MTSSTRATPPPRPRRSRARTLLPAAVAVWLVLEIWLLTLIAGAAGGWAVFLLLVAGAVAGGAVIRRAGRRALRNLSQTLGRTPGTEQDGTERPAGHRGGGMLVLAGVLLAFPGPLTDVAGLLLLLPPVRRAAVRFAERAVERHLRASVPPEWADALAQARRRQDGGRVVPGEVVRDDRPPGDGPDDDRRPPLEP